MELTQLQRHWDELSKTDPLWSILTLPGKENRQWDPDEFFRTGDGEVTEALEFVRSLNIPIAHRAALDFGCGVGRLTQALCRYFEGCCGVDIAPTMIDLANTFNRYGEHCRYYVNPREDLRLFDDDTFDFILSLIVLQHMRPEYSERYVRDFIRILAPGGVLVFQLPTRHVVASSAGAAKPTVSAQPLPDSGFRAGIEVVEPPLVAQAGSQLRLSVRLRNDSDLTRSSSAITGLTRVAIGLSRTMAALTCPGISRRWRRRR
jgi:SAM-dependent methyltransferase